MVSRIDDKQASSDSGGPVSPSRPRPRTLVSKARALGGRLTVPLGQAPHRALVLSECLSNE